jgi:hypothetical protein
MTIPLLPAVLLAADPDVLFATGFEAADWPAEWSHVAPKKSVEVVADDPARKFAPHRGKALRARLPEGELTALGVRFDFRKKLGAEPEEAFFRYYLRLGDDWDQTVDGGKLPGLSGTYNVAGWGGRKADGKNGRSARGAFAKTVGGRTPVGNDFYHADMKGKFGEVALWDGGRLERNRWYCLEQQVKLNAPDGRDGVRRAWADGQLALDRTGLRFRTVPTLKIERLWLNVYHGGTRPSPRDQHLYFDDVVASRRYIGPAR